MPSPTLEEFRALSQEYSVVPVWREVLADLETPVSAFAKLVGDGDGFLLESVEHGEHWGRFSFIGRDPVLTLVARGLDVEVTGELPPGIPVDQGALAALEALLDRYQAPKFEGYRRSTGESSATSATTSCAKSSASPMFPPTRSAGPTPS